MRRISTGNGPALALVQVKPFVDPEMRVAVELVALAGE